MLWPLARPVITDAAAQAGVELLQQLGEAQTDAVVAISFAANGGYTDANGIVLPARFDGAALFTARKYDSIFLGLLARVLLQWGRAFYSAEIGAADLQALTDAALQWGRAFYSAEIAEFTAMGSLTASLQWGRAFYSAEMRRRGFHSGYRSQASMGPRFLQRGNLEGFAIDHHGH